MERQTSEEDITHHGKIEDISDFIQEKRSKTKEYKLTGNMRLADDRSGDGESLEEVLLSPKADHK